MIIEDWRIDYNDNRPHSALGKLTPTEFAQRWKNRNQQPTPHSEWTTNRGQVSPTRRIARRTCKIG